MTPLATSFTSLHQSLHQRGRASRPGHATRTVSALIAIVAGCAHAKSNTAPAAPSPAASDSTAALRVGSVPVTVDNRSTRDVVVYAVRGTIRRRLGSVPGFSRASLAVPDTFTADRGGFSLFAVAIASRESYTSEQVAPQPGVRLLLTLEPRLASSALAVVE